MIALLSTVPAFVKGFWAFIANDGGLNEQANRVSRLIEANPVMNQATLICSCDSGKVSKLYYLTP